MRKYLLLLLAIMLTQLSFGADHPEAKFGIYGIEKQSTVEAYQKYVGRKVMYIPESTPSYEDKDQFLNQGGQFNFPYILTKITGNNTRMTFYLKEANGKKVKKLVVNNQNEYYSYGKYTYCITDKYSIPLVVVDKLEEDKNKYVNSKANPENDDYLITDLLLYDQGTGYPVPSFEITNTKTNTKSYIETTEKSKTQWLGKVLSDVKVKAQYLVVGIKVGKSKYYPYNKETILIVQNSLSGQTKEINESNAQAECFKEELSGKYLATLAKVEKPEDPTVRYGETKVINEKDVTKFNYIDKYIDILIFATSTQFNFMLKNVSENSLKVIWNEAVFVDYTGSTSKIMHVGTKYSQKEADQPSTVIIKGAKIDDLACPTQNVRYSDVLKEWVTDSMFPSESAKNVDPIRLMLPIQVKDVINEYVFVFEVNWVYNNPELLNL